MKKAISVLFYSLFALTILYPAGVLITVCFGYRFELISVSAFAIAIAVLSACVFILDLVFQNTYESKTTQILLAVITPLSLVNAVIYTFKCPQIWVLVSVLVSAGCCCYLDIKHGKPTTLKIAALVLSVLMVLPIGFFSFFALILGDFGHSTIVQTVESPSGKYYAQVINSDEGALGGDAFVDVYKNSGVNLILFKIEKKPQRVYSGDWGEFYNMQIHWKDDSCLVINAGEYKIE